MNWLNSHSFVHAGDGNDTIGGSRLLDGVILGGAGNDEFDFDLTRPATVTLFGGEGKDLMRVSGGVTAIGGDGIDTIFAGNGAVAFGGEGDDRGGGTLYYGGGGNDNLSGSGTLYGGDSADVLRGFEGALLFGGADADRFILDTFVSTKRRVYDIADFDPSEDLLRVAPELNLPPLGGLAGLDGIRQVGDDVVILALMDVNGFGNLVTLRDVELSALSDANIV
ncbi:MAG: hypothetical protein AAFR46_19715 [Pseudomonadota bacterium]